MSIAITGHCGLGDNIYQRPFVREVCRRTDGEVYLKTPWPQIYHDIENLRFIRTGTVLRTHGKNERVSNVDWADNVDETESVTIGYYPHTIESHGSILAAFESQVPITGDLNLALPIKDEWRDGIGNILDRANGRPIAMVRPVTTRSDWKNTARNPLPEYVAQVCDTLREAGHFMVGVADVESDKEWFEGQPPQTDLSFYRGELHVGALMALVEASSVLVGGTGWIIPASFTTDGPTPILMIYGGHLATNKPSVVTHPDLDCSSFYYVLPDDPCDCSISDHDCEKRIAPEQVSCMVRDYLEAA